MAWVSIKNSNRQQTGPFFALPSELQLMVYGYLQDDRLQRLGSTKRCIVLYVRYHPLVNVQLVCSQFRDDYLKEIGKQMTAVFCDHENANIGVPPNDAMAKVAKVSHVEFRILIRCDECPDNISECDAHQDLQETQQLLSRIMTSFLDVTDVYVNLGLAWKTQTGYEWPRMPHGSTLNSQLDLMTSLRMLERIDIYQAEGDERDTINMIEPTLHFAYWRKKERTWTSVQRIGLEGGEHDTGIDDGDDDGDEDEDGGNGGGDGLEDGDAEEEVEDTLHDFDEDQ